MVNLKPNRAASSSYKSFQIPLLVEIVIKTNFYVISLILIINRYKNEHTQSYFIIVAVLELTA